MIIALFFVAHWQVSVFFQTFFLHRYGAHRMLTMSKGWERFFYLCTYVDAGLELPVAARVRDPAPDAPRLQRHAAGSALADEPLGTSIAMMLATKKKYDDFAYRRVEPEARFDGRYPEWPALDGSARTG